MTYTVFQFNLTIAESNMVNALGWDDAANKSERVAAFLKKRENVTNAKAAFKFYETVADINAKSLDEVFGIGNGVGDKSKLVARPNVTMCSVSVGDVILTPQGDLYMVAPVGFAKI
jgi:hypothetical protein